VTTGRNSDTPVPERGTTTAPPAELDPTTFPPDFLNHRGRDPRRTQRTTPSSCHKNEKQQRRSKIRRTQKVIRPDNDSIPDEVTLSPGRTTHDQKMKIGMEIYQVPSYPTGKPETKILPSVRGCEGVSSVSGDGVPAIRGKNSSATRRRS
jgi:hypothetical protein